MTHHSGFVCFVGRPNAGKSTLTNAIAVSYTHLTLPTSDLV